MSLKTLTDIFSSRTDYKISKLQDYLNTLTKQLKVMAEDYIKKVESEAIQIEDETERDQFYEESRDEYWDYKDVFPTILLNSFHVSAYALLESELRSISARIGKKQKQLFDVSEIKGNDYLDSASLYIKKLTNIDCKTLGSWDKLKEGQRLRNLITHSDGSITTKQGIQLAKKHNVLSPTQSTKTQYVLITPAYSKKFLTAMRDFFTQLYKATHAGDIL